MENNTEIKYAGFFSRVIAWVIDVFILSIPLKIFSSVLGEESVMYIVLGLALWWLYTSYSIYKWQGTPGKRAIGLYVLDLNMEALSFQKASMRFIFYFLSSLPVILYLIFIKMMQFESENLIWIALLLATAPVLMMFFNKKGQTLYDYWAKTVVVESVIDVSDTQSSTVQIPHSKREPTALQKGLRIIIGIAIFIPLAYGIFYFVVLYNAFSGYGVPSTVPNTTVGKTIEYNNTKIDFYKSELEKSSAEFIEAESMYDILQGYVKKDLSLNCMQFFLQKEGNEDWLNESYTYRTNARNKYANTTERVKKANKNESYMGHHFYEYDLNDVHHIEEEIADSWDVKGNSDTCQKSLPADGMYTMFIYRYIENRESALQRNIREIKTAKNSGFLNKSFYKKQIKQIKSWLEILHSKHPDYKEYAQGQKEIILEKKAQRIKKKESKLQKNLWKSVETGSTYPLNYFNGLNANIKNKVGDTPLMVAVKNGHTDVVRSLSEAIVNVWEKDYEGKTAFDYIKTPTSRRESIFSNRMYGALRVLEVTQIVRNKAKIVQYSYKNDTDSLQITIKGARCDRFVFPGNTKCKALAKEKQYSHPIFKAIKSKDNALFDTLLPSIDIKLKDKRNHSLLWRAISYHNLYVVDKLLQKGADINESDHNGLYTPIFWATTTNDTKLLKVLLKNGANVNAKGKFGNFVLSKAMYKCDSFEAIALLLDNGANPYLKNKHGKTVFDKEPVFCKDKANIVKMQKLLKERSTFSQ